MATLILPEALTLSCSSIFIPFSTILLGLRFYTRRVTRAGYGLDDWLMVPAYLLVLGMQITMIVEFRKKMIGFPDPNFKPGELSASTNLPFWPFELQQVLALGLVKISVVLLYRRIFHTGAGKWQNWTALIMLLLLLAWTVSYFFAFLFICRGDPSNYWKSAEDERTHCVETQKLHLSFAISDTILDILVIVVVIPMIWGLQMTWTRRLAVTAVFCFGLITVAASLTRMAVFLQSTALRYDPQLDFEYLNTSSIYWSMLETGLSFLVANSIIAYGLLNHYKVGTRLRKLNFPRFPRLSRGDTESSRDDVDTFDQHLAMSSRNSYMTETTHVGSLAKFSGRSDLEDQTLDDRNILVVKEFGTTIVHQTPPDA